MTARLNEQITASEVRVNDEEGVSLGVMATAKALDLAREKGVDLVEVTTTAQPPVVKLISFDKYRYQEMKKMKKQKVESKSSEQKRVQISVREAEGDLRTKAARANKFLGQGSRVEILVRLRGRENRNREFAIEKLEQFLTMINPEHTILSKSSGSKNAGHHPNGRPKGITVNAIVALKK